MRCQQLLLPSALLSQALSSSVAFQLPHRNIIAAARRKKSSPSSAAAATPIDGPLSRLGRLNIPKLRKSTTSKRPSAGSAEDDSESNKRILALVTTCCLACLVRPGAARAAITRPSGAGVSAFAALLVDPGTSVYAVGQIELTMCALVLDLLRRASLLFLASVPLVAVLSLARSAGDRSSRWKALFADYHCCRLGIGSDLPVLQIEQSIHRAVPQTPELNNSKDPTIDELKAFDKKAQEYEKTIEESLNLKDRTDTRYKVARVLE